MLRVFAPAKINLTLQVGPPGGDGMHPLQSVVAFADVGDWVEVAPSEGLTLAMDGPFAPMLTQDEDNLVLRAARLLAAEGQVRAGAALRLSKHLPVASGIGGGSSDAAAALKALNQLWALDLDVAALAQLGRRLGADVPVCLGARSAWMTGAGEQVAALALPEMDVVLVNPLRPAPTAQVFQRFDAMKLGADFEAREAPAWRSVEEVVTGLAELGNDLAAPARFVTPEIDDVAAALGLHPLVRVAFLSGSGATMVGVVREAAHAHHVARDILSAHPAWWVAPARLGAALDATKAGV